jgi:hypothetical protein
MHIDTFHEEVARGNFWLKHCPALLSDPEEEAKEGTKVVSQPVEAS